MPAMSMRLVRLELTRPKAPDFESARVCLFRHSLVYTYSTVLTLA